MVTKKITTIWNGTILVNEKYVNAALEKKEELELPYTGKQQQFESQRMTIPAHEIRTRGALEPDEYPNKHGDGKYKAWRFKWQPDKNPQAKLL